MNPDSLSPSLICNAPFFSLWFPIGTLGYSTSCHCSECHWSCSECPSHRSVLPGVICGLACTGTMGSTLWIFMLNFDIPGLSESPY